MFLKKRGDDLCRAVRLRDRSRHPPVDHDRPLGDAILREIVDYIHSNLHRNVTLSELSALVHLTPRYFCGVFKQATGRPPHQYLIE